MFNKIGAYLGTLGFVMSLVCLTLFFIREGSKEDVSEDVVYVDVFKLFEEFNYKKELSETLSGIQEKGFEQVDSIKLEYEVQYALYAKATGKEQKNLERDLLKFKNSYLTEHKKFEEYNEKLTAEFDGKIRTKLNNYIKAYSRLHHYKIVFGVQGTGTLLYADTTLNITEPFVKYANMEYAKEGEK